MSLMLSNVAWVWQGCGFVGVGDVGVELHSDLFLPSTASLCLFCVCACEIYTAFQTMGEKS